jgi:peptidoglycan-associated lipoprotein
MNKWSMFFCVLLASFVFLTAGCAKRSTIPDEGLVSDIPSNGAVADNGKKATTDEEFDSFSGESSDTDAAKIKTTLETAYFDFDSWVLTSDARETIRKNYEWMKANPDVRISIEGHTDERGSDSYNLALGENRAKSVMKYVIVLGADPALLSTISYGEENPADSGQNEESWAKNRRVEFVIK